MNTSERKTNTLGFVGIGLMGSRMVARLLNAGFDVWVWNRSPDKCLPLITQGAKAGQQFGRYSESMRYYFIVFV